MKKVIKTKEIKEEEKKKDQAIKNNERVKRFYDNNPEKQAHIKLTSSKVKDTILKVKIATGETITAIIEQAVNEYISTHKIKIN